MSRKCFFIIVLIFIFVVPFAVPEAGGEAEKSFPPQAIIVASYRGDVEMVREILAAGPDKDIRNTSGDTALHVAMYQTNLLVIKLLLDYGFDPNAITVRTGYTPLHNAVAANNVEAARLLLQYGANKNIRGLDRLTPLDKARKEEKPALISLLAR